MTQINQHGSTKHKHTFSEQANKVFAEVCLRGIIADFKETSAPKTISMSETSVTVNESIVQLTKLVESLRLTTVSR